jgi:hypothetical protein
MIRRWQFLLWLALAWPAHSQTYTRQNIATILGFENNSRAGVFPAAWGGGADFVTDNQFVHSGKYSARIDRSASTSFSTITQSIPVDFSGTTIQWRGFVKMQNVTGYVALWAREDDAAANSVQFATMQPTPFAWFTHGDIANPGAFHWWQVEQLTPSAPHFNGKVVILVDETTQSSAEFHAMVFRAIPGAVVIGSTTAGADGDVSTVPIPGGLSSFISGLGVFYPDKRPTQRVGIVPDIWLTPTGAGLRAGRDELIDAAIRHIRATTQKGKPVR